MGRGRAALQLFLGGATVIGVELASERFGLAINNDSNVNTNKDDNNNKDNDTNNDKTNNDNTNHVYIYIYIYRSRSGRAREARPQVPGDLRDLQEDARGAAPTSVICLSIYPYLSLYIYIYIFIYLLITQVGSSRSSSSSSSSGSSSSRWIASNACRGFCIFCSE